MPKPRKHTPEYLAKRLSYDPILGVTTWRRSDDRARKWNSKWAGKRAGTVTTRGCRILRLERVIYHETHVAWALMTGKWPTSTIDHKDRDPTNAKWDNLREATQGQQNVNMGLRSNNRSGYKGVGFHKLTGKWRARTKHNGCVHYLGLFDTKEEAFQAYRAKASALWGEFFHDGIA